MIDLGKITFFFRQSGIFFLRSGIYLNVKNDGPSGPTVKRKLRMCTANPEGVEASVYLCR